MTYLDYSATTMPDDRVLKCFKDNFFNNTQDFTFEKNEINKLFNTNFDVYFTSGSTESNNMAIMGVANKYKSGHIISTKLEHSSVLECLKYLEKKGFIIDYVNLIDGVVDLDDLKRLICDETILVTINSVSSEVGVVQPISDIYKILKKNNILFHSDMTQSIGKINVDLNDADMISFGSQKFYGLKGVGVLLKRKKKYLDKLLYGERLYNYALIKSFVYSIELILPNILDNYKYVSSLRDKVVNSLKKYDKVFINSNDFCVPHIINISVNFVKPEVFLHMLEEDEVYISTKSACSFGEDYSLSVYATTCDIERAKHSIRISLSYLTTKEDIDEFLKSFNKCYLKAIEIAK